MNSVDGTHAQTIERLWGSDKYRNTKHRGKKRDFFETYFAEFIMKQLINNEDPFESFLEKIYFMFPLM